MAKIVLVGAGGVIFAQNFMKDILLDPVLRTNQLTLMDINAERLENSATICGLIASKLNLDFHPEKTTDLRKALAGADYVITIFRSGTIDHQALEYSIPAKYGGAAGGCRLAWSRRRVPRTAHAEGSVRGSGYDGGGLSGSVSSELCQSDVHEYDSAQQAGQNGSGDRALSQCSGDLAADCRLAQDSL